MFKILSAVIAIATLALAAFALAPAASTDENLVLMARLRGAQAGGTAVYEEYASPVKTTQVLAIRISGAGSFMEYKIMVQDEFVGVLRTDEKGNGSVRCTNPPMALPRVRAGMTVVVGECTGRFVASK